MFTRINEIGLTFAMLLLGSLTSAAPTYAQGVCPITTLRISRIQGRVVTAGKKEDEPLAQTKVELRRLDEAESLVASTLTDNSGFFEMPNVPKGQYRLVAWLIVKGEVYSKYYVRLNIQKKSNSSKSKTLMLIRLGIDCFNSGASMVKQMAASNNSFNRSGISLPFIR